MTVIDLPVPRKWKRRAAWGAAALLACALSFAWGRAWAPGKITERTKYDTRTVYQIVQVEKERRVEGPVRIVERRIEVPGPTGITVTTERTEDRGPVVVTHDLKLTSSVVATEASESSRVVTRGRSGWRASVAADPLRLSLDPAALRFGLERRLVGPIWFGSSYQHGDRLLLTVAGEF